MPEEPLQISNPFNKSEVLVLAMIHVGLMMGVVVFLGVVLGLNQSAQGKVSEIQDSIRILTWLSMGLSVATLIGSRLFFQIRFADAFGRFFGGGLQADDLKSTVRSAYIVKAAMMEAPALLGLVALFLIVLSPCDLGSVPRFYYLNFTGITVFMIETLLYLPTMGRLDTAIRSLGLGEGIRPEIRDGR